MKLMLLLVMMSSLAFGQADPVDGAVYVDTELSAPSEATSEGNQRIEADSSRFATTPLTLEAAIKIALANNPELQARRFDTEASHQREILSRGALYPQLDLESSYSWFDDDTRLFQARYNGEPGLFGDQIVTSDLVLRIPLYSGGRLKQEWQASHLLAESADLHLARSKDELVYDVTALFYSILAEDERLVSLTFSDSTLTEHLRIVNEMIGHQKAAVVDRMRIEVRIADIREKILQAENRRDLQIRLLVNLLGYDEIALDISLAGDLEELDDFREEPITQIYDHSVVRPDYQAARLEVEAVNHRVKSSKSGFLPSLSLIGTYGSRWMPSPSNPSPGFDNPEMVGRVGVGLSVPLYHGGQTHARWQENRLKYEASLQRLRRLDLQINHEIKSANADIESAIQRIKVSSSAITLGRESLRIEQQKYRLGNGTTLDVLDAQAALLELETRHSDALAAYHAAQARLLLATGRITK